MSALRFAPSVFVIGDEYEVLLCLTDPALVSLSVGGETYYEENSGALPSERTVARIRLPQAALDAARGYEVVTRKTIKRNVEDIQADVESSFRSMRNKAIVDAITTRYETRERLADIRNEILRQIKETGEDFWDKLDRYL